jgi:tRNA(Ile)-lysidine synthase
LGYSGGPDSKALLYALLEEGIFPHLAHVDHGWRETSAKEAQMIVEEAKLLNCPLHTIRLNAPKDENGARRARLEYFASLMKDYEALLLAHQADDLAETVLKRVFEGASLCHIHGMSETGELYGMKIWRPLLTVKKEEILQFLQELKIPYFSDITNLNPIYLRARMRKELFPFLNQTFGKEARGNLALLAERSSELKEYLDEKIAHIKIEGQMDLSSLAKLEKRHLLQKIMREKALHLSREEVELLLMKERHSIETGGWKIGVKRPFLLLQQILNKSLTDR